MEEYISEQKHIHKPVSMVYTALSDFSNFTPIIADKVEGWEATENSCSFEVKGFKMSLRIVEREENKMIKVEGDEDSPFDFVFWLQMLELGESETRIRVVLHIKLNMMMRMMLGDKLQEGVDQIAEQIAYGFNNAPNAPNAPNVTEVPDATEAPDAPDAPNAPDATM